MQQGVVAKFDASHSGTAIVLDNGEVFSVSLPAIEKIDAYLEHRRKLGKPAVFEIE